MMPLPMRTKAGSSDADAAGLSALGGSKTALTTEHGEVDLLGDLAGLSIVNEAPLVGTEVSVGWWGGRAAALGGWQGLEEQQMCEHGATVR